MAAARAPLVPTSLPTLHIYRNLLREASYLPPAVSPYVSTHIRRRFRQHVNHTAHQRKRLERARNALRQIRAANYGEPESMMRLVLRAFGRSSLRRRELLSDFVRPRDQAVDSKSLSALLGKPVKKSTLSSVGSGDKVNTDSHEARNHPFLDKWDRPKLLRLLHSQQAQEKNRPTMWQSKGIMKSSDESSQVPKTDIWGRPTRPERLRTVQARFWKRNSSKLMPPLGKGEWDLLRRLSEGAQNTDVAWMIPERRTPARPLSGDGTTEIENKSLDRYATEATAQIDNRTLRRWRRHYGPADSNPFGETLREWQAKPDRWYRRLYKRTWYMTPQMEQDPNTLEYKFHWGVQPPRTVAPTKRQMLVFEGVDARGQKVATKKQ